MLSLSLRSHRPHVSPRGASTGLPSELFPVLEGSSVVLWVCKMRCYRQAEVAKTQARETGFSGAGRGLRDSSGTTSRVRAWFAGICLLSLGLEGWHRVGRGFSPVC